MSKMANPSPDEIRQRKAEVRQLLEKFTQEPSLLGALPLAMAFFGLGLDLVVELVAQLAEHNQRETKEREHSQQMFSSLQEMMKLVSGREELFMPVRVTFHGQEIQFLAPPVASLRALLSGLLVSHSMNAGEQDLGQWEVRDATGKTWDPFTTLADLPADFLTPIVFSLKPGVAA